MLVAKIKELQFYESKLANILDSQVRNSRRIYLIALYKSLFKTIVN